MKIGLVRRGDQLKPTIVISARDVNQQTWWTETIPVLRERVQPDFEVDLVFLESILVQHEPDHSTLPEPVGMAAYKNIMRTGASCGRYGGQGSGTLRGMFTLNKDKTDLVDFGITNHHVLFKTNEAQTAGMKDAISPNQDVLASKKLTVSPSDDDHKSQLYRIRKDIKNNTKRTVDEKLLEEATYNTKKVLMLQRYFRSLQRGIKDEDKLENFNRTIGTTYSPSRASIRPNRRYTDEQTRQ
ncbi:hypothetical protein GQ44DRAFT_731305 [Phaeosphaeriaceae sp. PMI808]|nr:hypothetical protein GQ44DRAFT_731305 [Phaeosphaeriaceae sp. PMI808]